MAREATIDRQLVGFISDVKKIINIRAAYIFGSYVKNKRNPDSDIDIAIVSDDFSGSRFDDRKKLNPLVLKNNTDFEVHPFTTRDFRRDNPFVQEIISTGKKITSVKHNA